MDALSILAYGGIAVLVLLLVIFELKDRPINGNKGDEGYEYYAYGNVIVRIQHIFATSYKVYVFDSCPVSTKQDRYGRYFILKAKSTAEAEYKIDELYRNR